MRLVRYVLLFLWAGVIFYLSSEGSDASSGRSEAVVAVVQGWGSAVPAEVLSFWIRKSAHIAAYLIFGCLVYWVVRLHLPIGRRVFWVSAGLVLLYALSDELHQLFVPGRSAELRDVAIDTVAGAVGVGAAMAVERWLTK